MFLKFEYKIGRFQLLNNVLSYLDLIEGNSQAFNKFGFIIYFNNFMIFFQNIAWSVSIQWADMADRKPTYT